MSTRLHQHVTFVLETEMFLEKIQEHFFAFRRQLRVRANQETLLKTLNFIIISLNSVSLLAWQFKVYLNHINLFAIQTEYSSDCE